MNAAVLCPGPSLASVDAEAIGDYELVVGVNRAPLIVAPRKLFVDWWCFGDGRIFLRCDLPYKPAVFAANKACIDVGDAGRMDDLVRDHRVLEWEKVADRYHPQWGWMDWSATAALVCAAADGATCIDVYGADWVVAPDADGVQMPENDRSEKRWTNERGTWDLVVRELGLRAIRVRRNNETEISGVLHAGV